MVGFSSKCWFSFPPTIGPDLPVAVLDGLPSRDNVLLTFSNLAYEASDAFVARRNPLRLRDAMLRKVALY